MGNVKIKLNREGVKELLKSAEMQEACRECAERVLARAGDGYVIEPRNYPERSGYAVKADTRQAYKDNYENNTLLRALNG